MHPPEELTTLLPLILVAVLVAMVGSKLKLPYALSLVVAGFC